MKNQKNIEISNIITSKVITTIQLRGQGIHYLELWMTHFLLDKLFEIYICVNLWNRHRDI